MKSFKIIIIAFLGIFIFSSSLSAQRGPEHQSEKLKTALDLSEEQWEQLQPILEEQHEKMKALHDQEFESKEERKTAFQNIRKETEEAAADILTAEQIAKWGELKEKRSPRKGRKHKARLSDEDKQAMKQELKVYKQENIEPVLRKERMAFDQQITADDKAEIDRLRVAMKEKKKAHKAKMKEMKESRQRPTKEDRMAHKEKMEKDSDVQSLKAMVEKYREPLTEIHDNLEPQRKQWRTDMKEISKKYKEKAETSGKREGPHARRHGHKGKSKGEAMHKKDRSYGHFLLMDPNEKTQANKGNKSAIGKFKVYPNPASSTSTVEYTLKRDSRITLSIRDKEGNTIRVVEEGNFAKGDHRFEVPVSDLKNGIYYFSIEDEKGKVKSKKVVVNN